MSYPSLGGHRDVAAFRAHWRSVAPDLDCDAVLEGREGPLAQPFDLDGRVIGNRWCVHPMEGWDGTADGRPSGLTRRRWRRFGRSGAKLIWGGEAFAVREDGRANPNQLCLGEHSVKDLTGLRQQLLDGHAEVGESLEGLYVGLQLTHSGRHAFARPRIAAPHPVMDRRQGIDAAAALWTDGELEAIGERYVQAAKVAREAGFDFVDVKCCHGYLLHELLGAHTRDGAYGGSLEHRTALLRRIVAAIRQEAPGLDVAIRVSIAEVHPYGRNPDTGVGEPRGWQQHRPYRHGFGVDADDPRRFDWREPFELLRRFESLGVRLVSLSLGSPYTCPHLQRPAAFPPSDGYQPPEDPLRSVARHIHAVRRCREAGTTLAFAGTGYSYLQEFLPHVAQHEVRAGHVDFVGIGRMVLSYPELPLHVLQGRALERRRICRTFSDCTTGPRNQMVSGCYPLDPHYRGMPEAARVRALRPRTTPAVATRPVVVAIPGGELHLDDRVLARHRTGLPPGTPSPGRLAFAAAHVVMKAGYADVDHAPDRPGHPDEIVEYLDMDATVALRRFLDEQGFGIAEAMDTAQRFAIGEVGARRLIAACGRAGLANGFVAGAGADGIADTASVDELAGCIVRQGRFIQEHGGWVIVLPVVQLARRGAPASVYVDLYREVFRALDGPLFVHWLGEAFLPELRGYFPGDSFETVMALAPEKVRGCKLSLLDASRERTLRRTLRRREQIVLTGDDWHFADLIRGDGVGDDVQNAPRTTDVGGRAVPLGDFSHALLGVFDAVAEPAGLALRHLAAGHRHEYDALMKPCEELGRLLFEAPVAHYKAGLAFLSWLNGRQPNAMLVNHEERTRDRDHLLRVVAAASRAGVIRDAAAAASRLESWLQEQRPA